MLIILCFLIGIAMVYLLFLETCYANIDSCNYLTNQPVSESTNQRNQKRSKAFKNGLGSTR
jgi:hypothetical protein